MHCECTNNTLFFLNTQTNNTRFLFPRLFVRKSFKQSPTTLEWARFQKYAQRMRKLNELGTLDPLCSEVFPVLQLYAIREPILPNLKTLNLRSVSGKSVPFIPLFLSPRTIAISLGFLLFVSPVAVVAPMVAALPILCPGLQKINFESIPRDPMVAAAVSRMLIANNPNTFRSVRVDSPLTEEVRGVISKLPNLRELSVIIEEGTSLPSVILPNLTELVVKYYRDGDLLRMFHGATFGKLEDVTFISKSEQNSNFLEAFERVALAASVQNTLTQFSLYTSNLWRPNYSSLLPFTHLTHLDIGFPCDAGCSSRVDDEIIINLSRAIPKLGTLRLGDSPCSEIPIGVTSKGLMALANHCPDLSELQIHFQVASLITPLANHGMPSNVEFIALRRDCALSELNVGEIPVLEESVSVVAVTLARIFPHLQCIEYVDENWAKVDDAIRTSRRIFDYSGKERLSSLPRNDFSNTSPGAVLENDN